MSKVLGTCEDWEKYRLAEKRHFRCVYCMIFFVFFWISLWSRLLPRSLRPFASMTRGGESVWQETSRAAQTVVGFAFMG